MANGLKAATFLMESRIADAARAGSGPVKSMRFGLFQPGTSRMVLDMAGPHAIQTAALSARHSRTAATMSSTDRGSTTPTGTCR